MEGHVDRYFDEALNNLKGQITIMGDKVVSMVDDCISAFNNGDVNLASKVIDSDQIINNLEIAIDKQCTELLVRYQPAASDLRYITRGLKIATDLERIGDLAVNISKRVEVSSFKNSTTIDITEMTQVVKKMLTESLQAFLEMDLDKANSVLTMDDCVDELTEKHVKDLLDRVAREHEKTNKIFPMTSVVRHMERIADHSTNIAELAIFTIQGKDVRHGRLL